MKNLICILYLSLLVPSLFSQNLAELFYMVPDDFALDFKASERKTLLKNKAVSKVNEGDEQDFELVTFDKKNGYMEISSPTMESNWEMCFWKTKSGSILVGIGISENMTKKLFFFKVSNGKMSFENNGLISNGKIKLNVLYLAKSDAKIEDIDTELCSMGFTLPRHGVNIQCMLNWTCDSETKKNLRGDKCDLIWKDGYFEPGEPYF